MSQAPADLRAPPPQQAFARPVKVTMPHGTITWYPRGEFFAHCEERGHGTCRNTGSSTRFGAKSGRPLAYLHAWLSKGGHPDALDAPSHKWVLEVTNEDKRNSRTAMLADPAFADLLTCERRKEGRKEGNTEGRKATSKYSEVLVFGSMGDKSLQWVTNDLCLASSAVCNGPRK